VTTTLLLLSASFSEIANPNRTLDASHFERFELVEIAS